MSNWESFLQCFGVENEKKAFVQPPPMSHLSQEKKNLLSIITDWLIGILITYQWLYYIPVLVPLRVVQSPVHPNQPGFLFETPKSSSFQGFPNIQHLREILKSQRSPKSWRKTTETPRNFHMFVGLFFVLLSICI